MWQAVFGNAGVCTHEIAARLHRMIGLNEAFSIEVIKMIEDSGELIHLWARWWGTFCMCECLREERLDTFTYTGERVCVFMCHRCGTSCEMGLAWRRPERSGAMPTGGPCLFTVHLNRQPNTYHHPSTAYMLQCNLTFIRTKLKKKSSLQTVPVSLYSVIFFITVYSKITKKIGAAVMAWEFLEVTEDVIWLDFNQFVSCL